MGDPVNSGGSLIAEIENSQGPGITLWWLGHCGFVVKSGGIVFYVDPCLSTPAGHTRIAPPLMEPAEVTNADLVLCTHRGPTHMDEVAVPAILKSSPRARVLLPKGAADYARTIGVPYERMTTTDSDLRVEYFKRGLYGRIYSVPSAHPELDWTPAGGYPHLGYLIRFGEHTIYHAGDGRFYDGLVERLRPYRVTAALLPVNGNGNFEAAEAAQLAEDIGARWLVPMHYGAFSAQPRAEQPADLNRFIDHMLGFRPSLGFKVFQPGERWAVPVEA